MTAAPAGRRPGRLAKMSAELERPHRSLYEPVFRRQRQRGFRFSPRAFRWHENCSYGPYKTWIWAGHGWLWFSLRGESLTFFSGRGGRGLYQQQSTHAAILRLV